jgi:hypothetical protein
VKLFAGTLGQELIRRHALPVNAEIDAYHVAVATVNGMVGIPMNPTG